MKLTISFTDLAEKYSADIKRIFEKAMDLILSLF